MIQQFHSQVYIQNNWNIHSHKKNCTPVFIAALFIIHNSQKEEIVQMSTN